MYTSGARLSPQSAKAQAAVTDPELLLPLPASCLRLMRAKV
jgi:hypothetical protein